MDTNLASLGQAPGIWTDGAVVAGRDVPVRAIHFTELRDRIQTLWSMAGLGTLPQFSAGAIAAGSRTIQTSDPLDLRKWLEQYEESGYGTIHRARANRKRRTANGRTVAPICLLFADRCSLSRTGR